MILFDRDLAVNRLITSGMVCIRASTIWILRAFVVLFAALQTAGCIYLPVFPETKAVSALNRHPNLEIKIYNPFSVRFRFPFAVFQVAEFAIDGNRLNHRMHNKLLVADNQLAILGGRNIGDDYFGYNDDWFFIDTDLLVSGSMVTASKLTSCSSMIPIWDGSIGPTT